VRSVNSAPVKAWSGAMLVVVLLLVGRADAVGRGTVSPAIEVSGAADDVPGSPDAHADTSRTVAVKKAADRGCTR
jgi:hypothetical protein